MRKFGRQQKCVPFVQRIFFAAENDSEISGSNEIQMRKGVAVRGEVKAGTMLQKVDFLIRGRQVNGDGDIDIIVHLVPPMVRI